MEPVSLKSLLVKKSLLPLSDVFCSLDRGCSLTKLLYKKAVPEDPESVSLEMAFYRNDDFEKGLDWLSEKIKEEKAQGQKIHLTGVGGDKYRQLIEEKTGLTSEYVDEFGSQTTGCHFLVANFEDDAFCYEDDSIPMDPSLSPPDWVMKLIEKEAARYAANMGKRLPTLFAFCGSAVAINALYEDKTMQIVGGTMFGGKSMMGMAKLIAGTNDYDELMELAAKGSLNKTYTESGDVIAQHEKSQFPNMPKDLPMMPFGKASEPDAGEFSREDRAAGVVGALCTILVAQMASACRNVSIPKVYVGGHLFRAKVARQIFQSALLMNFASIGVLKFRFLSNGHTGCIGAMLLTSEQGEAVRDNQRKS